MTREQMKEALKDVESLEKDFCRNLTEEEANFVVEKGRNAFLNKLGMDDIDFSTMKRIFSLISAGFTESEERYDEELKKENIQSIPVLESLLSDLKITRDEQMKPCENKYYHDCGYKEDKDPEISSYFTKAADEEAKEGEVGEGSLDDDSQYDSIFKVNENNSVGYIIDRLRSGETLELSSAIIDEILSYLDLHNESYSIKVINNKVSMKF